MRLLRRVVKEEVAVGKNAEKVVKSGTKMRTTATLPKTTRTALGLRAAIVRMRRPASTWPVSPNWELLSSSGSLTV